MQRDDCRANTHANKYRGTLISTNLELRLPKRNHSNNLPRLPPRPSQQFHTSVNRSGSSTLLSEIVREEKGVIVCWSDDEILSRRIHFIKKALIYSHSRTICTTSTTCHDLTVSCVQFSIKNPLFLVHSCEEIRIKTQPYPISRSINALLFTYFYLI